MTEITNQGMEMIMEAVMEVRMKQAYAAWRAGYDFLHIISDPFNPSMNGFFPSNSMEPPQIEYYQVTYDLRQESIPEESYQRLIEYEP